MASMVLECGRKHWPLAEGQGGCVHEGESMARWHQHRVLAWGRETVEMKPLGIETLEEWP